jgi:hypothetical protein
MAIIVDGFNQHQRGDAAPNVRLFERGRHQLIVGLPFGVVEC